LQNKKIIEYTLTKTKNLIIPLSFVIYILAFYFLAPETLQNYWTGRGPYTLILWLLILETIISWEKITKNKTNWKKLAATTIIANIPLIYTLITLQPSINEQIINMGKTANIPLYDPFYLYMRWPLTLEFTVFTITLATAIAIIHGKKGFTHFPITIFLATATTTFSLIDLYYPHSQILQAPVPLVTNLSATILNQLGYQTKVFTYKDGSVQLSVSANGKNWQTFAVAWPCAGIHSQLIYTIIILLFMRLLINPIPKQTVKNAIPKKLKDFAKKPWTAKIHKKIPLQNLEKHLAKITIKTITLTPYIIVFTIGAIGTFFTNILRIVTIATLTINYGETTGEYFHNYYGELFFITWIIIYLTILATSPHIPQKIAKLKKKQPLQKLRRKLSPSA
jgi:exosortase/archaeosortase family protein